MNARRMVAAAAVVLVLGTVTGCRGLFGLFGNESPTAKARISAARTTLAALETALNSFEVDVGRYPTAEEGLNVLVAAPAGADAANWKGPYLRKAVPLDPWGKPYVYLCPGVPKPDKYEVLCYGSDGKEGGSGAASDLRGGPGVRGGK